MLVLHQAVGYSAHLQCSSDSNVLVLYILASRNLHQNPWKPFDIL